MVSAEAFARQGMPLIYRAMLADGNKPQVGSAATMLGVRVPPAANPDLPVDPQGNVRPASGGMSVAPAWRLLPVHRIPRRLRHLFPRAAGSNQLHCWRLGDGLFTAGPLAAGLYFRPDPHNAIRHGFVEPSQEMRLLDYQAALAATQLQWLVDEA
jgi:hypothetical protein